MYLRLLELTVSPKIALNNPWSVLVSVLSSGITGVHLDFKKFEERN